MSSPHRPLQTRKGPEGPAFLENPHGRGACVLPQSFPGEVRGGRRTRPRKGLTSSPEKRRRLFRQTPGRTAVTWENGSAASCRV